MTDRYGNKRLNATIDKYDGKLEKLDEPLYLDAYNQAIHEDGVFGCIRCGISFRNMDFILEPVEFRGGVKISKLHSSMLRRAMSLAA